MRILAAVKVENRELENLFPILDNAVTKDDLNNIQNIKGDAHLICYDYDDHYSVEIYEGKEYWEIIHQSAPRYDCMSNLILFKEMILSHKFSHENNWYMHKVTNCIFYIPNIIPFANLKDIVPPRSEHSYDAKDDEAFANNLVPVRHENLYFYVWKSSTPVFAYETENYDMEKTRVRFVKNLVRNGYIIGEIHPNYKYFYIKNGMIHGLTKGELPTNTPIVKDFASATLIASLDPYHHADYMMKEENGKKEEYFKWEGSNKDIIFNIRGIRNPTIEECVKSNDLPF